MEEHRFELGDVRGPATRGKPGGRRPTRRPLSARNSVLLGHLIVASNENYYTHFFSEGSTGGGPQGCSIFSRSLNLVRPMDSFSATAT
jgi:hypothetical protein